MTPDRPADSSLPPGRPSSALRLAALRTLGAALLGAGIWIGVAGPFGARLGLVAVAIFVGWLIGSSARQGAAATDGRLPAIAVGGGAVAWVLALVGVYVYSLAVIPDLPGATSAGSDLLTRLRDTPITAFYAPQVGLLDFLQGALLLGTAWWSAR